MKVLLVNPWADDYLPPPAIGYLQAALKHWRVDVKAYNLEQALATDEQFDIVGVTFHSFSVRNANILRNKFKCKLICGGHHPSALPEQMLAAGYDQVVIGEGENAIIAIVQGNNEPIVQGAEQEHKYFYGINEIPMPDYTGINFGGCAGISIITSRGCPFACNFCASSDFWQHRYKMRSADNVILEIERRKAEGYTTWIFEDDNFTLNKTRTYEICRALDGKHLWQCTSRAEALDADLCAELYRAGCRKLWLGVETLSQAALDRCNKNTTVERMLAGIANAARAGIPTISLFIVGLPGDTAADVAITRAKIKDSAITEMGANLAWILPGTAIHAKAKEQGFDDKVYLESGAPYYTYEQSLETLRNWEYQIMTAR
jgi:anaerobic magnesium-protoporphyrin IX monomethyl ester cyclase